MADTKTRKRVNERAVCSRPVNRGPFWLALCAALLPLFLILFLLKPADLVYVPHSLNPGSQAYSDAIERAASTSEVLITIALAIAGATVVWYLREAGRSARHYLLYAVFVLSLVSMYSGVKLGYSASLTLASDEPDLMPLLALLRLQALLSLTGGLLLTGIVVFCSAETKTA